MMKFMFMIMFLIPIINNWWLFMLSLMVISFNYIYLSCNYNFMSMISSMFGSDLISYILISLTLWIMFLMVMASFKIYKDKKNINEFLFIIVIMLMSLMFTFSVNNLMMFYLSFETSLIPTLFLIFGWGYQPERLIASYYLLFYTLVASLPMLISTFYIYNSSMSLYFWLIDLNLNFYLYLTMILAFLIKMPMVFVHFWLPKAHVEAPISGSMVLAGILLKMGGYGLYRVLLFMNIYNMKFNFMIIMICLYGMFMVGLVCLYQVDIKSLIAYSSVAHMCLVLCGIMTLNVYGFVGSLILMLGHGFCSSGLFCLANFVYERTNSRSLFINKGLISLTSILSMMWFMLCANNMACPPSLNLLGEIFIINSVIGWDYLTILFLGFSSFLSCCYSIYLYSITQHGNLYKSLKVTCFMTLREYILMFYHWIPLNTLLLHFNFVCYL